MILQNFICGLIRDKGPMPLDVFQHWTLYHPQKGYYNTQAIFGQRGDFITAPEISQMFGEMVGLWLLDVWCQMGAPASFQLIELGPGRGTLMADILRVAERDPAFLKACQIHLVEISSLLKKEQEKRLKNFVVTWSTTPEEALREVEGPLLLVANEFFDAIPIKQFEKKGGFWYERCVDWKNDTQEFLITLGETIYCKNLPSDQGVEGDVWELSPERDRLFGELVQHIKKRCGVLWISDYGYGTELSFGDSLQGLFHKQKSDPLSHVGEADLSSHVNFGHFKKIAKSQEVSDLGPCAQGIFLKNLGLEHRLARLKKAKSPKICARLEADYLRLTHFLQMGALFQVYVAYHPKALRPCGF